MKLPDYREKQRILYITKKPATALIAYGDLCLEANRIFDAIEFYQKAGHNPGLEKIKDFAQQNGDMMIFQQATKALKQETSNSDWDEIGRQAIQKKKYTFARSAFEKSGNTAMLDQINEILKSGEAQ
ncbi:MAG: hypothetical protein JXA41_01705 [Deltaproteobacteria bacterium]|nr:hypothetical protein [Deltaproteobacteria bacterium]